MANAKRDYFEFSGLVSLILAIIPITACVLGVVTRFKEGHIVAAIIRIFLGAWIVWILDLVFMLLSGRIFRLLSI